MKINILKETTVNPLNLIGERAGVCWGADISNKDKNIKRAINCILSGHGRLLEYVNIEFEADEVSSRCLRQIYTHLAGSPTRLQASTRYINYDNFSYYIPDNIEKNQVALYEYNEIMKSIKKSYSRLIELGIDKEDAANVLPFGMNSKIVMKCNLRMLENFMGQRLCSRAYKEIRDFANLLRKNLVIYGENNNSDEWKMIAENILLPKCERVGYCTEDKCCGRKEKKEIEWKV